MKNLFVTVLTVFAFAGSFFASDRPRKSYDQISKEHQENQKRSQEMVDDLKQLQQQFKKILSEPNSEKSSDLREQFEPSVEQRPRGFMYKMSPRLYNWWQSTSNWFLNKFKTAQPQVPQPIAAPKSVQPKAVRTPIWKRTTDSNFAEYYEQQNVGKPRRAGDVYNPADYPANYFTE